MATRSSTKARTRSLDTLIEDLVSMVDGDLTTIGIDATVAFFGEERAAAMVPLAVPVNPIQKYNSIVAHCLDYGAVSGAESMLPLFVDGSSEPYAEALPEGYAPIPTSILEGDGESPGWRRALDYLCAVGFAGVALEHAPASGRIYPIPIPPTDLRRVVYRADDPTVICRVEWDVSLPIHGYAQDVTKVWDITDKSNPFFGIFSGRNDVTKDIPDLAERKDLRGASYLWRLKDGTPYIPVVILGRKQDAYRMSWLSDAVKTICVKRHATTAVFIDSAHPVRNVSGATPATVASGGVRQVATLPGSVVVWEVDRNNNAGDFAHWEWAPGGDVEKMTNAIHADEADVLSQFGIPVNTSSTGGAPLVEEMARQDRASQNYADRIRLGLVQWFTYAAALANRLGLTTNAPESGFTFILGDEVEKAKKETTEDGTETPRTEDPDGQEDPVPGEPSGEGGAGV